MRQGGKRLERFVRRTWRRHVTPHFHDLRYGHMPVAMITGSLGKTTTSRLLAAILRQQGHTVGLTCTDGIFVDGRRVETGDSAGYAGAWRLLRGYDVTAAVLETARGELIRQGPFMKRRKVGALLNVASEHIGVEGIDTLDDMARLKARVVRGARFAVLNADDERCAAIAETIDAHRLILFSAEAQQVQRMLAAGARAVTGDADGWMILLDAAGGCERLVRIADIPVTLGGLAVHYTANAMAAAALAVGLDVPTEDIRDGLAGFRGGRADNPGRWNVFEGYPFTFVAERGMNETGFTATSKVVEALSEPGRRLLLLTAIGNRSEAQYEALAAVAARVFDWFVVYDNVPYRRGRAPDEVPALLAAALQRNGIAADRIECVSDAEQGLALISAMVKPGDFVLMLQSQLSDQLIERALAPHRLERERTVPCGLSAGGS